MSKDGIYAKSSILSILGQNLEWIEFITRFDHQRDLDTNLTHLEQVAWMTASLFDFSHSKEAEIVVKGIKKASVRLGENVGFRVIENLHLLLSFSHSSSQITPLIQS
jgi:hypothetical protein